jgi:hypothetical protein
MNDVMETKDKAALLYRTFGLSGKGWHRVTFFAKESKDGDHVYIDDLRVRVSEAPPNPSLQLWRGRPVDSLTREELMEAIGQLAAFSEQKRRASENAFWWLRSDYP